MGGAVVGSSVVGGGLVVMPGRNGLGARGEVAGGEVVGDVGGDDGAVVGRSWSQSRRTPMKARIRRPVEPGRRMRQAGRWISSSMLATRPA